jgi:hypothetical protein
MNIKEAKEQIKNAMTAYFTKDEYGSYRIPIHKQRPVCMIGPPGIGKTAIMEQIASELGVGLVSYSMTHHTRQSALGLPSIIEKEYGGMKYSVSEYTMSEIIGSIYDLMRETGVREGILFLDEINCVSETLSPCMLQFLQYKIFGQHRIPDGWIVVTAGNPPEYNKSVRDFDIVTWDRLKRIDVDPDYGVWVEYAGIAGIHPAIKTYLAARKKDFYSVKTTVDGKSFVTARGWDDLSQMIVLYETNDLPVDEKLIVQYLQNNKIAKDFAIYYDLFNKYRNDYQVETILEGTPSDAIILRARMAKFDERLSLMGLLFDAITSELQKVIETEDMLEALLAELKKIKDNLTNDADANDVLGNYAAGLQDMLDKGNRASSLSIYDQRIKKRVIKAIEDDRTDLMKENVSDSAAAVTIMKTTFDREVTAMHAAASNAGHRLNNLFLFCEAAFGEGEEILLLVTELTADYRSARFIGHYGCDKYFEHNNGLKFYERQQDILSRIKELGV